MKKRIIIVYSMSRSGHHAIINWLQENWPGTSFHFNHCYKGWHDQRLIPGRGNIMGIQVRGIEYESEPVLEIYSIEDFDPDAYSRFGMNKFPVIADPDHDVTHLLIMRDPYNWLASSWLRGIHPVITYINETGFAGTRIELFEKHIAVVMNVGSTMPSDIKLVVFNKWFISDYYREYILNELDIPNKNNGGLGTDKICSETSFFDDLEKKKGQELKVLDRWRSFMPMGNHHYFWDCITKGMKEFSRHICALDPVFIAGIEKARPINVTTNQ